MKDMSLKLVGLCFFAAFLQLTGCTKCEGATGADLILRNGRIYTVNDKQPWAEALAVRDGRIVYVGDNEGAKLWSGKRTRVQDLKGQFLLPGFVDAHSHILLGGAHFDDLVLDPKADLGSWLADIAAYIDAHPDKEVIIGSGFLASSFGGDGPGKTLLDEISPRRPVFIMDEGMHGAWLNSAALAALNITADTPDPVPGFDYYKRDESGEPTGYLLEGTVWSALEKLNKGSLVSVAAGSAKVIKQYNRYGITAVFDAGPWEVKDSQLDILRTIADAGNMTIRFQGSQYIDNAEEKDSIIGDVLKLKAATRNTAYPIDTLKIMVDGTVEGMTAAMFEDYQGQPENRGETVFSSRELNTLVDVAVGQGLDVHFHALGERAITVSLDAIELAKAQHPEASSRFTLAHLQVMRDSDIERFAALGVIAQASLLWTSYDDFGKSLLSNDQFQRYYRLRSLEEAGVTLTFGCDYPSNGGGLRTVAPLYNIEIGHTRQQAGQKNALIQPRADERLDIASLIRGYTLNGAYQMRLEEQIGSIETGKLADLVLLDKNLFETEPHRIHAVKVLQTWLGGSTVYEFVDASLPTK